MNLTILIAAFSIVFRYDDMHAVKTWSTLGELFDDAGFKYCLALPLGHGCDADQEQFLRKAQKKGHELMDHCYTHSMYYTKISDKKKFAEYSKLPFVAETDKSRQFLKFRFNCDLESKRNQRFIGSITNGVLSSKNGETKRFSRPDKIYVPSLKKFFGFYSSPDGNLKLGDFWVWTPADAKSIPDVHDEEMLLVSHWSFSLEDEVVRFQAQVTRDEFKRRGLKPPHTWIQPGGWDAFLPGAQLERIHGREFGYTAADCINYNGRYALRPVGYIDSDSTTLDTVKANILKAKEKDVPVCILSHTWLPKRMKAKGNDEGWKMFLAETKELLDWVKANKFPVRTFEEAVDAHYGKLKK